MLKLSDSLVHLDANEMERIDGGNGTISLGGVPGPSYQGPALVNPGPNSVTPPPPVITNPRGFLVIRRI
jgi:hypothetical protein